MDKTVKIAVISHDTLRAVGIQNLLVSYFAPVEIELCTGPALTSACEGYDYYFADENFLLPGIDPRRIVRLAAGDDCADGRIGVSSDVQAIVAAMELFLSDGRPEDNPRHRPLSDREIQVLKLVVSGAINKEIVDRLSISFNTVLTHRKNISAKTGIKTVSGLTFYALINGYISPSDIDF